jgi:tetratricopeptide (TPR) repeat protein
LEQVLQESPDYVWALDGKAYALLGLDDIDGGLLAIERRLKLEPEDAWAIGLHGAMLFQIEEYATAARELERSTNLEPNIAWTHALLSDCYRQMSAGMPNNEAGPLLQKAAATGREAVELMPEDLTYRCALAESLLKLGGEERPAAVAEYQRVLEAPQSKPKLEFYDAKSAGWAAFRLASCTSDTNFLIEAERLHVEALALKRDRPTSSDARCNRNSVQPGTDDVVFQALWAGADRVRPCAHANA